jgi:hypothetical protein
MLRDLQQIDDPQETRLARQRWSDIRKTDRLDRIHFDLSFFHAVPGAGFDMGTRPYSDAASDFSATNPVAKTLCEHHVESLHLAEDGGRSGWRVAAGVQVSLRGASNFDPIYVRSFAFHVFVSSLTHNVGIRDRAGDALLGMYWLKPIV